MTTRVRLAAGAAGAAVLLGVLAASIVRAPADGIAVLAWRGGGTPRLLQPGFSLRVPFLQRLDLYPGGAVRLESTVRVASRQGSVVELPIELNARPSMSTLLKLYGEGGAGGARAALRQIVEERAAAAAARVGTWELASGHARQRIERQVRAGLEGVLGGDLRLVVAPPRVPQALRAEFEPEAVYARRQATGINILLVGIDGADWDFIDPLIARGELPHLARLKSEGVWGRLRSSVPTLSPLLWTTVATGMSPDRHGINDFLVVDPSTGTRVPINSTFRRCKALWNILSDGGLSTDVIAWWATWPAEPINGHLISDRVAYSTFDFATDRARSGAVHPAADVPTVESLRVDEDAIDERMVARFLHIDEAELRRARSAAAAGTASEDQESIAVMVRILAATETYRRVALDLLERRAAEGNPARLFAVYFQGVDEVNHRFAHCAPPRMPLCSDADYRRFRDAVAAFYRYQDEMLGELIERAQQPTVIVLSDHGFASGAGRPDDVKPFIEGQPGLWHDLVGIFLAAGPGIGAGEVPSVSLYDIAPTVLRLLGLPIPEDMAGHVVEAALAPGFERDFPPATVHSYEGLPATTDGARSNGATRTARGEALGGAGAEEIVEQLRALGYVGGATTPDPATGATGSGPGTGAPRPAQGTPAAAGGEPGAPGSQAAPGVPTLLYHTNLGAVYTGQRQFELAEAEYRQALRIDPASPEALAGLAIVYDLRGDPERSLNLFRRLVPLQPRHAPARLYKMAELYVRLGRVGDGIAYLEGLKDGPSPGPRWDCGVRVALGTLYAAARRDAEAEAALLEALEIDPAPVPAMQELFSLYDRQGRAADLEPRIRAALALAPHSAMHYNWLGLVLKRRGDLRRAATAFRQTLEVEPGLVGAMANLGGLYLQQGKAAEAVTVLEQALEREPRNTESRANLIVALGMEGDLPEARRRVEEAEQMGQRQPQYYNALGYALHVNGLDDEALQAVRQSLALDPRQTDALRLRAEIEGRTPEAGLR